MLPTVAPNRDVGRITKRLRQLTGSPEPAVMFSQVAAVCVPAICDSCVIELTEGSNRAYRIHRPGPAMPSPVVITPDGGGAHESSADVPIVRRFVISGSAGGIGGHEFSGTLSCCWYDGAGPTAADDRLIDLILGYACAVIESERRPLPHPASPAGNDAWEAVGTDAQRPAAHAAATIAAVHHRTRPQSGPE